MEIQEELIAEKTHAFNQDIQMSFTEFLKGEFVKKVKFNSSFSLRSYARFLDIHFATLSHLMSGKRIASEKTILKLAPRLNATEEEVQGC